jgi:UDP-glucuronate 4-epimerase
MQPGDVYQTYSDTSDIEKLTGFKPQVNLDEGLRRFVEWMEQRSNKL